MTMIPSKISWLATRSGIFFDSSPVSFGQLLAAYYLTSSLYSYGFVPCFFCCIQIHDNVKKPIIALIAMFDLVYFGYVGQNTYIIPLGT